MAILENACAWFGPASGLLGCLGSVLLAVPYFDDFLLRQKGAETDHKPDGPVKQFLQEAWIHELLRPSRLTVLMLAIVGALMLATSFSLIFADQMLCKT